MVGGSGVTVAEGDGSGVAVKVSDATFVAFESESAVLEAFSPDPPCDAVGEKPARGTPAFRGRNASPPHAKMMTATMKMPQVILFLNI